MTATITNADGSAVSPLGLGCGRLGSLTAGQSAQDMLGLLAGARELGVTVFDTSNIYGQGLSEKLLGQAFGRDPGVCIITKAGYFHPLKHRLLAPVRAPVAALLKRSSALNASVRSARVGGLPRNYSPEHLRRSLTGSLRRLRRSDVGVFLLHSPRLEDLADGAALDALGAIRAEGLARRVGVSCDDLAVLDHICSDPRVEVIEAPFGLGRREMEASLGAAAERGACIIAREILSGAGGAVGEAVRFAVDHPSVHVALVGTSRLDHLRQATEAAA